MILSTNNISGRHVSGWEHNVVLDGMNGLTSKYPNILGILWQIMNKKEAIRNDSIMRNYGINIPPSKILGPGDIFVEGQRRSVRYLLQQPYLDAHALTYSEVFHSKEYQKLLLDIVRKGMAIRRETGRALDLLGGKTFGLLPDAVNPMVGSMTAEISNLMVMNRDICAMQDWSEFDVKEGDLIAKKGDVIDVDTRLYPLHKMRKRDVAGVHLALYLAQEAQDTALWSLLESFGCASEFDLQANLLRKSVHELFKHAAVKMKAYAEDELSENKGLIISGAPDSQMT